MLNSRSNNSDPTAENNNAQGSSSADVLRIISEKSLELRDMADEHHLDILRYLLSTVAYEAETLLMMEVGE